MSTCSTTNCETKYSKKRYKVYAFITMVSLVLPFITLNGNQLFLLSFDKKQLHLFFGTD